MAKEVDLRRSKYFTVAELARELGVHGDRIRSFIADGRLRAVDVGCGTRKRWRISEAAVSEFLAARSNFAPPPPQRKNRRKRSENYF
jgi:excisionase family DNA binding protein